MQKLAIIIGILIAVAPVFSSNGICRGDRVCSDLSFISCWVPVPIDGGTCEVTYSNFRLVCKSFSSDGFLYDYAYSEYCYGVVSGDPYCDPAVPWWVGCSPEYV